MAELYESTAALTDPQFLPFRAVEPRIPVRFHPQNLAEIAAKQTNNLIDLGEGLLEFGIGLVAMADGRLTPTRPLPVLAIGVGFGLLWTSRWD